MTDSSAEALAEAVMMALGPFHNDSAECDSVMLSLMSLVDSAWKDGYKQGCMDTYHELQMRHAKGRLDS